MGTVECITTTFSHHIEDIEFGLKGYAVVPFMNHYCTYMFNYTGGVLVQWAKHHIFQNKYNEKEMDELTEKKCQPGPTTILTLPYFGGAATPYQNIHARGSIINLSLDTRSEDVYKSILEGLSYEMKYNVDIIKPYGIKVNKMIVSGGGSLSQLWLRIKANVFNQKIYPLNDKESGIQGAIMLCAVALKTVDSLENAVQRFVSYKDPILPTDSLVTDYEIHYNKYKNVYDAVSQFSKK